MLKMDSRVEQKPRLRRDLQENNSISRQKDTSGWLVIALIVIILAIVIGFVIVALFVDANTAITIQRCPLGLCKFDRLTGIKTCPEPTDTKGIIYNTGIELCTTADYCQPDGFTCAVQTDQTLNCNGICGPGNAKCKCIANPI